MVMERFGGRGPQLHTWLFIIFTTKWCKGVKQVTRKTKREEEAESIAHKT